MRRIIFVLLVTLITLSKITYSQMFGQEPTERQRYYDVLHITIDVKLDLKNKTVDGWVLTKLVPLNDNFTELEFDAMEMQIRSAALVMEGDNMKTNLNFDYDTQKLKIKLDKPYSTKDTLLISVLYNTTDPEKGLYFISPDVSFPNKRYEVWSQGEGEDNRYWFPCYDYPNDKASTDMFITVDSSYQTLSNGLLTTKLNNGDGTVSWHWVNELPHSSYLVMLAAGNWDVVEDEWNGIPISSYIPPGEYEWGKNSYRYTADIVKFFSEYIGFKYPWGKFSQVAVQDFIYGGMENTSAVVLFEGSVYDEKTEPDYNAASLIAHETAHQWWGDVLTCKNWNEIWLNESFATFFQCLYFEHLYGKDDYDYNIYKNGNNAIKVDSTESRKPIYIREGLTTNTYDKGSVVLSMLRYLLGDEKFRTAMNIYITKNQFTPVVTKDLLDAVHLAMDEQGKIKMPADMSWFFEEWIYKAGQPEYKVSCSYDENEKEVSITARQVQRLDTSSVFKIPVPVTIVTSKGNVDISMQTGTETKTYKIKVDSKPQCVIFNKGNKVLCKLNFAKPKEDWLYQLKKSPDAIDRITALTGLKDLIDDKDVTEAVYEVLMTDNFWGVRYEAAQLLGLSKNRDVMMAFVGAYVDQTDSRIKRRILTSIADVYQKCTDCGDASKPVVFWMKEEIKNTSSYYITAEGIAALIRIIPKDQIYDAVIPFVNRDSHSEIIRRNVMAALDSSKDARALDVLLEYGQKGSISRVRNLAINALDNYINDPRVLDFLNNKVLEMTRSTQNIILRILEKAKSPSSKPYLEKLLTMTNDPGFTKRVKEVLQKIE